MYIHVYIYMDIDLYETRVKYKFSTYVRTDIICIQYVYTRIYIYEYRSPAYIQISIYYICVCTDFATTVYIDSLFTCGVATVSRIDKIIGLFCKRDL